VAIIVGKHTSIKTKTNCGKESPSIKIQLWSDKVNKQEFAKKQIMNKFLWE